MILRQGEWLAERGRRGAGFASRHRTLLALALIVVAGALLRFDAAASPSDHQSSDERSYAKIAHGIARRNTYGLPVQNDPVHWMPGAPMMFAVAYRLNPTRSEAGVRDVAAAYNWQALVGTLTIVAAFLLGLLIAGRLAGLISAAAVAFYPPLIAASHDLLSEPLGAMLATSALAATVWAIRDPGRRHWKTLLAGALLGLTVLTRADLALLPAIAALAIAAAAWHGSTQPRLQRARRALGAAVPLVAATLVLVLPWSAFASKSAGSFVPLSTGGGSNFFIGTYLPGDGSLYGTKRNLAEATQKHFPDHPRVSNYTQLEMHDVMRMVAARRPELSEEAALKAEALSNLRHYALGRPVEFAGMAASKVWRLWGAYTVSSFRQRTTPILIYHRAIVLIGILGLLAGIIFARRWILLLPAAAVLYITALNAILVSESRHNLTLLPTLATAGVAGIVVAVRRLQQRRSEGSGGDAGLQSA
ncbi:MAG: hypothetical protein ACR2LK_07315 [Solirubrobacteraceae bacterium]